MSTLRKTSAAEPPRLVGRFVASQALLWMLAAPVLARRLRAWRCGCRTIRAPLLIFPLLVGCGLGLLLAGLTRLGQVGHRATLWSGAILAVAVAVAGQHYCSFLDFKAAVLVQKSQGSSLAEFPDMMPFSWFMHRQATLGRPVTANFKLRGAAAWASWAADGLLLLLAASAIVHLAYRTPYCSLCRSWYRTTRAGPVTAETARRLAEAAGLPIGEPPAGTVYPWSAQYRLSHCVSGCGPCRLELAASGRDKTKVVEAWLSAAERERVARVLDGEN